MVRAALARDIPVTQLVGRFLAFGHGRYQQRLSASATTLTNSIASHLAANKTYTHRVLEAAGLPMARYGRAYSVREAVAAAERIGYPVVVKPNSESMGAAVSVGMKNRREVTAAYRRARRLTRSVIVEEFVRGDDHRLLIVGGKLVAAAKRVPAHVVGDGVHSVEQLVALVNADPRRGADHSNTLTRIVLDEQADRLLGELGYTAASVPQAGEVVYLRRNANLSAGGTAEDLSERVHPANREIAERAAKVIGLDIAGVDLLTSDVSVPLWKCGGRICEINSRPGLRSHLWPAVGEPRDVLGPILDMLFPPGQPVRVPVVAVTGTGDTRSTAELLAAILTAAGRHVGLAAGRRVFSGGRRVGREKHAAPAAARMILLDPEVDVAVLELRPRDVLRHGLGYDAIDVTVVVDELPEEQSAERQLRPATPLLLDAIRVVARSTRSVIYACHSDPATAAIAADAGQARLCRVVPAPAGRTPAVAAVARGERAVQRGRTIRLQNGARDQGRLRTAAILQRLSGPEADRYRSSALYATLAAHSLGIAPQVIARGLRSWAPLAKLAKPRLPRRP
jgi:cyanophycin synthetase